MEVLAHRGDVRIRWCAEIDAASTAAVKHATTSGLVPRRKIATKVTGRPKFRNRVV